MANHLMLYKLKFYLSSISQNKKRIFCCTKFIFTKQAFVKNEKNY